MGADTTELRQYIETLERQSVELDGYYRQAARELAGRLLALVVPRTVVGHYPPEMNRIGGTLRRGWVSKDQDTSFDRTQAGAPCPSAKEMHDWAQSLDVEVRAGTYTIKVHNPVEYASFIEYGFTKRNGEMYPPQHMMEISVQQLEAIAPRVLEQELYKWLKKRFGD